MDDIVAKEYWEECKPCPFCGEKLQIHQCRHGINEYRFLAHAIFPNKDCPAGNYSIINWETFIKWNSRYEVPDFKQILQSEEFQNWLKEVPDVERS